MILSRLSLTASAAALCLIATTTTSVLAADENGQFAIKGGGLQTCVAFLNAMDARSPDLTAYGGWIEGYLTGQNQRLDDTFDATPWQSTQVLLSVTQSICRQMPPESRFIDAFDNVLRIMLPSRLPQSSSVVTVRVDDQSTVIYKDVLTLIRERLIAMEFDLEPTETPVFDDALKAAVAEFQTKTNLPATGLPDQRTLLYLFVPASQPKN